MDARLGDIGAAIQETMESHEVELDGKTHQVDLCISLVRLSSSTFVAYCTARTRLPGFIGTCCHRRQTSVPAKIITGSASLQSLRCTDSIVSARQQRAHRLWEVEQLEPRSCLFGHI